MTTMTPTKYLFAVQIWRTGLFGRPKRHPGPWEVYEQWVRSRQYADNRVTAIMRRQRFIKHTVKNGVHELNYWGPMTRRRMLKMIHEIMNDPNMRVR